MLIHGKTLLPQFVFPRKIRNFLNERLTLISKQHVLLSYFSRLPYVDGNPETFHPSALNNLRRTRLSSQLCKRQTLVLSAYWLRLALNPRRESISSLLDLGTIEEPTIATLRQVYSRCLRRLTALRVNRREQEREPSGEAMEIVSEEPGQ